MLHMDEKQLKAINSKASKKKFNDHVLNNNVDKVNKMCAKGLDPNFHCQDSHTGGKAHYTLLTADILSGKNVRTWVSMDFT